MKEFFGKIRGELGPLSQAQVDGINYILVATSGLPIAHRAYLLAT